MTSGGTATDADGALSGVSVGLAKTGTGTYTLTAATPATLASELRSLVFTPTAHQASPGGTVTTSFGVVLTDTGGATSTNTTTTVVATAVADAPTITGAVANQATTDLVSIHPFSTVTINDVDTKPVLSVTITLRSGGAATDADGGFSAASYLTHTGPGIYMLTAASPATLTSELRALVFNPTHDQVAVGQTVKTEFDILASLGSVQGLSTTTSVNATDVACYCSGTAILAERGETAVEDLAVGDLVQTASGQHRRIKWLGRRSYAGRFLTANRNVNPVRFRAGALGNGLPRRDLLVSPEHAMFLDGMLVPAKALVNGNTIRLERGLDRVDYFHVELDSHDVLLAEGAPSESFLEDGNRGQFHNAAEHTAMYPDAPAPGQRCAALVDGGPGLEAIRRRLAEVALEIARAA